MSLHLAFLCSFVLAAFIAPQAMAQSGTDHAPTEKLAQATVFAQQDYFEGQGQTRRLRLTGQLRLDDIRMKGGVDWSGLDKVTLTDLNVEAPLIAETVSIK